MFLSGTSITGRVKTAYAYFGRKAIPLTPFPVPFEIVQIFNHKTEDAFKRNSVMTLCLFVLATELNSTKRLRIKSHMGKE